MASTLVDGHLLGIHLKGFERYLYEFSEVAITKYPKLSDLNGKDSCLIVLEAKSSTSGCQQGQCLLRAVKGNLFLASCSLWSSLT